ncbi:hypothetical protein EB796_020519 [Bugula neritina]|uniref:Uncharacterized protein n=1 Tax=Bugula neritina TaxID=10212 RepID=A0A7J7J505_BUGNE|nr:hypothetical protein EB796_020519 [Bugula neritina]
MFYIVKVLVDHVWLFPIVFLHLLIIFLQYCSGYITIISIRFNIDYVHALYVSPLTMKKTGIFYYSFTLCWFRAPAYIVSTY